MAWTKKVLRVNLTRGTVSVEPLNMEWAQQYLGQRGLASKYLVEEIDPKCDALGPDNKLMLVTGPLTGTMASTGGRYDRLFQFRRLHRRRAQERGLGHADLRGQVAQARIPVHPR